MRKLDFLTKVVVFDLAFLTIFTVACFISHHITGTEPATLIQMVFTVFGMELLLTMVKTWLDKHYGKSEKQDEEMML